MNTTTVAVDLAMSIFLLTVADEHWRIVKRLRLTCIQFERWLANRSVCLAIMETYGSAPYWAHWLNGLSIKLRLLPSQKMLAGLRRFLPVALERYYQSAGLHGATTRRHPGLAQRQSVTLCAKLGANAATVRVPFAKGGVAGKGKP